MEAHDVIASGRRLHANGDRDRLLAQIDSPFYEFIADLKWSPVNPFLFAAVTSSGQILIYNIAKSLETPIATESISQLIQSSASTSSNYSSKSLSASSANVAAIASSIQMSPPKPASLMGPITSLSWLADGSGLLLGDSLGKVLRLSIATRLSERLQGDDAAFRSLLGGGDASLDR